jgi:hypothetical protein
MKDIINPKPVYSHYHVTFGGRSGIGLDKTDPIELRQDGCLARRDEMAVQESMDAILKEMKAE